MRKLGRTPSHHDRRSLSIGRYVDRGKLPAAPPARDWTGAVDRWGMYRNDRLGDCTCAAIAHLFQAQAAATGRTIRIEDGDVVGLYSRTGDYDPAIPASDAGAEMIDVLKELRSGSGLAGQRIGAFVAIDTDAGSMLEVAVNLFGGVYVGADLPLAAQDQTVWDVAPRDAAAPPSFKPNSWGGHAMAMLQYDHTHVAFITWGGVKIATRDWFATYVSEAWVLIDSLWVDQQGLSPSGFDMPLLLADLVEIDRNGGHAA